MKGSATTTTNADIGLFEGGPPLRLQQGLRLLKVGQRNVPGRALIVIAVGWVPLVILAMIQHALLGQSGLQIFLADAAVHARSLIAAPLLVVAEALCAPRLGVIVKHFQEAGLIPDHKVPRFEAAIASTRRLLNSKLAESIVVVLTFAIVAALILSIPREIVPNWHKSVTDVKGSFSLAGWWHVLVSIPILLVLIFGWIWRVFLWTRILWLLSQLDLRLVAAHPDHAAGLGFVGYSVRAFSVVALALLTIVAGKVANGMLYENSSFFDFRASITGGVSLGFILFLGPLTVFTSKLLCEGRRAAFNYGELAGRLGRKFETRWFGRDTIVNENILDAPDFSAATDLSQVVSNVYAMRLMPLDLKSFLVLVGAMASPFLVVGLIAMPFDVLLARLKELLF